VQGAREADIEKLVRHRGAGYRSPRELWIRAGLSAQAMETLARADAFRSLGLGRRQALWAVKALGEAPLPLFLEAERRGEARPEPAVALPAMPIGEEVIEDYAWLRLSLKSHPLALLRRTLESDGLVPASGLAGLASGRWIKVGGLVLVRQRPGSANGIGFITLEDETGVVNLVVYPDVFERYRRAILGARLLAAWGSIDRQGMVVHVKARRFVDLSDRLDQLGEADPAASQPASAQPGSAQPGSGGLVPALARADHGSQPKPMPPPAARRRLLKATSRDFH
jgi:error-prone DNA polymerase